MMLALGAVDPGHAALKMNSLRTAAPATAAWRANNNRIFYSVCDLRSVVTHLYHGVVQDTYTIKYYDSLLAIQHYFQAD